MGGLTLLPPDKPPPPHLFPLLPPLCPACTHVSPSFSFSGLPAPLPRPSPSPWASPQLVSLALTRLTACPHPLRPGQRLQNPRMFIAALFVEDKNGDSPRGWVNKLWSIHSAGATWQWKGTNLGYTQQYGSISKSLC